MVRRKQQQCVVTDGASGELDDPIEHHKPVETAAYRIAQEALTNVARHAAASHTVVDLTYGPDALVVQIDDDGRSESLKPSPAGKGIVGMRERVHALGGELEVGRAADHGFRVRARIPLGATP